MVGLEPFRVEPCPYRFFPGDRRLFVDRADGRRTEPGTNQRFQLVFTITAATRLRLHLDQLFHLSIKVADVNDLRRVGRDVFQIGERPSLIFGDVPVSDPLRELPHSEDVIGSFCLGDMLLVDVQRQ